MIKMERRKGKNHLNFEISDKGATAKPIGSMLPGVAIRMGSPQEIANEDMPKLGANQNKSVGDREYLYVFGKVTYTDGFETPRMTEFCFRYDTDSRSKEGIAVDTARYQPYANTAT